MICPLPEDALAAIKYPEENGVYSYGCYVSGTPETFLALIESGTVTQVWIEDTWINIY